MSDTPSSWINLHGGRVVNELELALQKLLDARISSRTRAKHEISVSRNPHDREQLFRVVRQSRLGRFVADFAVEDNTLEDSTHLHDVIVERVDAALDRLDELEVLGRLERLGGARFRIATDEDEAAVERAALALMAIVEERRTARGSRS